MENENNSTQTTEVVENTIDSTEYFFVEGSEAVRSAIWNQAS